MSLARFAFQACSFNHSDISPFRINDLRWFVNRDSADCDKSSNVPRSLAGFSSIDRGCRSRPLLARLRCSVSMRAVSAAVFEKRRR